MLYVSHKRIFIGSAFMEIKNSNRGYIRIGMVMNLID